MKFVCRKCETFMTFADVEPVADGSLGITFVCETCESSISMVTNAGETQMVKSLGVSLGGREAAPEPLEMTRASLEQPTELDRTPPVASVTAPAAAADAAGSAIQQSMGKCPFANQVAAMTAKHSAPVDGFVAWTEGATTRLLNVPDPIRPIARQLIEGMARDLGRDTIDDEIMDLARDRFM